MPAPAWDVGVLVGEVSGAVLSEVSEAVLSVEDTDGESAVVAVGSGVGVAPAPHATKKNDPMMIIKSDLRPIYLPLSLS